MMEAQMKTPQAVETTLTVPSPVGPLWLSAGGGSIVGLGFGERPASGPASEVVERASQQLDEYFAGERESFELPLAPPTKGLLGRVLAALAKVPYGRTVSYKELTLAAGLDRSRVRDVGAALGRNPLVIVLPCHRVIGSDGSLVGFGGGLERKRRLLDIEAPQLRLAS
jgi:methylated-DNA-[protein]-cysteine S-methyltransferase